MAEKTKKRGLTSSVKSVKIQTIFQIHFKCSDRKEVGRSFPRREPPGGVRRQGAGGSNTFREQRTERSLTDCVGCDGGARYRAEVSR